MTSPKYKQFLKHQDIFKRFIGKKLGGASTINDITFSQHKDDILVFLSTPVLDDNEELTGDDETTWSFFTDLPKTPDPIYKNLAKVRNKVLFNSRLPESRQPQMKTQAKKLTVDHLKRIIKEEVDSFVKEQGKCAPKLAETNFDSGRDNDGQKILYTNKKTLTQAAKKILDKKYPGWSSDKDNDGNIIIYTDKMDESVSTPVVTEDSNIIAQDEEGVLAFESVAETRARKTKALKEAKIRHLRKVIREMIRSEKAAKAKAKQTVIAKKK